MTKYSPGGKSESAKLRKVADTVNCQFIVKLFNTYYFSSYEILVMEYHPLTLSKFLHGLQWPFALIKKLFMCIANGISACRVAGLSHCDIKPANVLISPTLVPKVADFGLAYSETDRTKGHRGSRAYAAPEVFKHRVIDSAIDYSLADQWSLGVLLY